MEDSVKDKNSTPTRKRKIHPTNSSNKRKKRKKLVDPKNIKKQNLSSVKNHSNIHFHRAWVEKKYCVKKI